MQLSSRNILCSGGLSEFLACLYQMFVAQPSSTHVICQRTNLHSSCWLQKSVGLASCQLPTLDSLVSLPHLTSLQSSFPASQNTPLFVLLSQLLPLIILRPWKQLFFLYLTSKCWGPPALFSSWCWMVRPSACQCLPALCLWSLHSSQLWVHYHC